MILSEPVLEQNYMHSSILIENISFTRYCNIKTTKYEERHGRLYFDKFTFKSILKIEHSLLSSRVAIFRYVCGSCNTFQIN